MRKTCETCIYALCFNTLASPRPLDAPITWQLLPAFCRRIAPTVLLDVPEDSLIMQEEIFGPLLPVLTVRISVHPLVGCHGAPPCIYALSFHNI